jgi:hypothetical protein
MFYKKYKVSIEKWKEEFHKPYSQHIVRKNVTTFEYTNVGPVFH